MMTSGLLCATDGSPISEKAVVFAADLARDLGQHLTFATVITGVEEQTPVIWDEKAIAAGNLPPTRELLAALNVAVKNGLQRLTCVQLYGHGVAAAIVGYAEKNNY